MTSQWVVYIVGFIALLVVDFAVMRGSISIKKSVGMTLFYIACALGFSYFIYYGHGGMNAASQFVTIFFLEKMLSVDNLLVMSLIFAYFDVTGKKQHQALFYGIIGAIFFRSLFILSGGLILAKISWLLYGFAAFLIYSGFKIMTSDDDGFNVDESNLVQFIKRKFGPSSTFLAAIIAVELCDVMFAVDSIPASFGVSSDAFIILTANLLAVLGLRSLYHAVSAGLSLFEGIEKYIGAVLIFLGTEICFRSVCEVPSWATMTVVIIILAGGAIKCRKA